MKRLFIGLLTMALMAFAVLPALAQDQTFGTLTLTNDYITVSYDIDPGEIATADGTTNPVYLAVNNNGTLELICMNAEVCDKARKEDSRWPGFSQPALLTTVFYEVRVDARAQLE